MDGFYGNEAIRGHSVARKRTKGVRGQLGFSVLLMLRWRGLW